MNNTLTRFRRQYVVAAKLLYFIQEKPVWWPFFQSIYSFVSSQFSKVDAIHVHLYLGLCEFALSLLLKHTLLDRKDCTSHV